MGYESAWESRKEKNRKNVLKTDYYKFVIIKKGTKALKKYFRKNFMTLFFVICFLLLL
jgi:hypothetical protein